MGKECPQCAYPSAPVSSVGAGRLFSHWEPSESSCGTAGRGENLGGYAPTGTQQQRGAAGEA